MAKLQCFVSGADLQAFECNEELVDAVVFNLTVLGEAANHVPAEILAGHPEIPWRQMVDLRNLSVHAYWNLRPAGSLETV
jgi:uncharacterized protein with HEPN domain